MPVGLIYGVVNGLFVSHDWLISVHVKGDVLDFGAVKLM